MFKPKVAINLLPVNWMGWLIYFLMPYNQSIAQKNIARVFRKTLPSNERKHLAIAYYSHLISCVKELFTAAIFSKKHLKKRIQIIGIEYLQKAISKNSGVIVLIGHFGNWELTPPFFTEIIDRPQYRLYFLRKSLRFKFLDALFLRRFEKAGLTLINSKNALRNTRLALKDNGVVFFPFDLRPPNDFRSKVFVDFLGRNTCTYTSPAYLAEVTGASVLSATTYRLNKKQHVIEFFPELEWEFDENKKLAILTNTQIYTKRLQDMLLLHPEQWFWSYKRWVSS